MTLGELALNTTDGRIYMKTPTGVVEVSYRDSRARSAISTSGTGITYDSATGVLSSSATSANTASAVVSRDSSGNFSAGTITAALTGNVTGNASGSSGSCTGNAATATTAGTVTTAAQTAITSVGTLTGLTSSGAVSITNATASSSKTTGALIVTGGVGVSGAMYVGGEITAYASDAALKTNVEVIENALEKVEAIRGVSYDWNDDGLALGLNDTKQIGVIAQEVEAVIPELVCDSAHEGYKTVKYDKLTALLIEAVKELSAKVKTLEAQLGGKPGL
jgi:hypothetical protein